MSFWDWGVKPVVQGVRSPNLSIFLNPNSHFLVLLCKTLVFFFIAWRWLWSILFYISLVLEQLVFNPFQNFSLLLNPSSWSTLHLFPKKKKRKKEKKKRKKFRGFTVHLLTHLTVHHLPIHCTAFQCSKN